MLVTLFIHMVFISGRQRVARFAIFEQMTFLNDLFQFIRVVFISHHAYNTDHQLVECAAEGPYVNGLVVVFVGQTHLRWSIYTGYHMRAFIPFGRFDVFSSSFIINPLHAQALVRAPLGHTGYAKVTEFHRAITIKENVRWFDISVNNP